MYRILKLVSFEEINLFFFVIDDREIDLIFFELIFM